MRQTTALLLLLLGSMGMQIAQAEANRDSLIEAWEKRFVSMPGTTRFESFGDGVYSIQDEDLPYDGELRVTGSLVRPAESPGVDTGFTHIGMVDFDLTEYANERKTTQLYYYWLSDRQTLYYSDKEQKWLDVAAYQASFTNLYDTDLSWGPLSFMLNYGIWIVLLVLLAFVFVAVGKQTKKARGLMDDTDSINQKASENLDRAEALQDELLSIVRESRDLQRDSNDILRHMLEALKR